MRRGIGPDDYITYTWKQDHRLRPDGLHTGPNSWNLGWEKFLDKHPGADTEKMHEQLNKMLTVGNNFE
jgi:hypothetical protein